MQRASWFAWGLTALACGGHHEPPVSCSLEAGAVTCIGHGRAARVELRFSEGYTASLRHYVTRDGVKEWSPAYGATYYTTIGGPFRIVLDAPAFTEIEVKIEPPDLVERLSEIEVTRGM